MLYVDVQYADLLGTAGLRNFKKLSSYVWRFSCPYCGDSRTNKSKARGFILRGEGFLYYRCHNCGVTRSLRGFIIEHADHLRKEYNLDKFRSTIAYSGNRESKVELPEETVHILRLESLPNAERVLDLPDDHPLLAYLLKRHIPWEAFENLFFVEKFKEFSNSIKPDCIKNLKNDHPRLVIPFYDENGKIFAFQGRALNNKIKPKYLTIKLDETAEKLFGLDKLDTKKDIYVTEGPIDSLFVDNCIAVAGGAVNSKFLLKHKEKVTIIFDNEPRNTEICKQIEKCISVGFKICLLPTKFRAIGKDLNELINDGLSKKELKKAIDAHTYVGMMAKVKYSEWRRFK